MKRKPFGTALWFVVAWISEATLVSCGSSGNRHATCAQAGKCGPGDQLLPAMLGACNADLAYRPCTATYQAYLDCRAAKEVCLAEGGIDPGATQLACEMESAAWNSCLNAAASDGGADSESEAAPEPESEAGLDAGPEEGLDARSDAGSDAGLDAGSAAGPDAGSDSGLDARTDAGLDAGSDARPDAGPDAGLDTRIDAGLDAGSDARPDAGLDAGSDAGIDAGIDAGSDVGSE
jgi:hypothetical protein